MPISIVSPFMLVAWVLFPLVMLAVCLGCGLLLERLAGRPSPGALLPGLGLALIVVVATVETESTALAPLTTWVVVALAVLGYAAGWKRVRRLKVDPWTLALGVLAFLVYAAPVVASGHPSFGGYTIDGDPTFHLLAADELLAHGHAALAHRPFPGSTATYLLGPYLTTDFPFGSDLAVGALRPLVGTNLAWIYAPFMAVFMSFGALALENLISEVVKSRPLRLLCAFIAAQASLAYWFYLIASIKELATSWLLTQFTVLVLQILRHRPSVRAYLPVLVTAVAALDVIQVSIAVWLAVPVVVLVGVSLWRVRPALRAPSWRVVSGLVLVVAIALAFALPALRGAVTSYTATTAAVGSGANDLVYLSHPLLLLQLMGIWPTGDPRLLVTSHHTLVYALIWLAIASALAGAAWVAWRRASGPLLLFAGNGIGAFILYGRSDPYAASKVMMILSVTAVLAAMLGAVALHDRVNRVLGWGLAIVLALAVLWTTGHEFAEGQLLPQPRFDALAQIDQRFSGQGPTLYTGWDFDYPAFFLRDMGAVLPGISPSGIPAVRPAAATRTVGELQLGWDPNDIVFSDLETYRLLVIPRSPATSRPPANYRLVFADTYYDVYRRDPAVRVLDHVPVTGGVIRTQPLSCRRIRDLGRRAARAHAALAAAEDPIVARLSAQSLNHPADWFVMPSPITPHPGTLILPKEAGTAHGELDVPRTGRYTLWAQGELTQRTSFSVAQQHVGVVVHRLGPGGQYTRVGTVELQQGRQPVSVHRFAASELSPHHLGDTLGDLVLTPGTSALPPSVHTLAADHAASLCGKALEWVEIVRPRA